RYWRAEMKGVLATYDQTVALNDELRRLGPGPLLTDDPAIAYRTGHPEAAVETWYFLDVLEPRGMFDPAPTASAIARVHYDSIMLRNHSQVYDAFKAPIDTAYLFAGEKGNYRFWVPLRSRGLTPPSRETPPRAR